MERVLIPGERCGCVRVPASKSQAHRLLICSALGEKDCEIACDGVSADIAATAACLRALGAGIAVDGDRIAVTPIQKVPEGMCELPCGESGSTLRFLLPLVGALGAQAVFLMEGRLPQRPLAPLDGELCAQGMTLRREGARLFCAGRLRAGAYTLPGNVSSQYISGLLMALPRLSGDSTLDVSGRLESAAYVTMTEDALRLSGVEWEKSDNSWRIPGGQRALLPPALRVEGDWSNAAFFLAAGALSGGGMKVTGLLPASSQGDRAVLGILKDFGAQSLWDGDSVLIRRGSLRAVEIDAAPIPDLIPVLSVVAAAAEGETRIVNAARLRLKESDRLRSTSAMLRALGADVTELEDGLVIRGGHPLHGGVVDSCGDHRIAMSAAAAACLCTGPVTVLGSECVKKSYPRFWEDWEALLL